MLFHPVNQLMLKTLSCAILEAQSKGEEGFFTGWKQGNTPKQKLKKPCLWRGFLLLSEQDSAVAQSMRTDGGLLAFRHAAGGPSHCHEGAFDGHDDSPKRAVERKRFWNQGDLGELRFEPEWIGSAFAHGRDDLPRQETQQLPSGGVPANCCCSQSEPNEEWRSSCKPRFDSNILYRLIRNLR